MDTPNKKKRFAKLRRGGGKTNDRPKVSFTPVNVGYPMMLSPCKSPMTSHDVMMGHHLLDHTSSELSRSWSNLSEPKIESTIVYDDFVVTAYQG